MYSNYTQELEIDIEKSCPSIFKNELRVPNFYLNIVKSKLKI